MSELKHTFCCCSITRGLDDDQFGCSIYHLNKDLDVDQKRCDQFNICSLAIMLLISGIGIIIIGITAPIDNSPYQDYREAKLLFQINVTNHVELSISNQCEVTNSTNMTTCFDVIKNKITDVDNCSVQGDCIVNVCESYLYVCYTKECWIKEQQIACGEQMTKSKCTVDYLDKTTYICDYDPSNNINVCRTECSDFECHSYNRNCKCVSYATNSCQVFKNRTIIFSSKLAYIANNTEYIIQSDHVNCTYNDTTCIKKYNVTYGGQPNIYYDLLNPKTYRDSIDYEDPKQDNKTKIIIVAYVLTALGGFVLLIFLCKMCSYCIFFNPCGDRYEVVGVDGHQIDVLSSINQLETNCSICHTILNNKDMPTQTLDCLHVFHTACINIWMDVHSSCPLCKIIIL
jgi:hypothetical protein